MNENKLEKRHYKPNVVYELLIHGVYHYTGCHCLNKSFIYRCDVWMNSGNYLAMARDKGLITPQEYKECVELINVWEFDTKEEAQEFERIKIQESKEKYGDLCKNKALFGNRHGSCGCKWDERLRKKHSISHLGNSNAKGHKLSEESKRQAVERRKPFFVKMRKLYETNNPQNLKWNDFLKYYKVQFPE